MHRRVIEDSNFTGPFYYIHLYSPYNMVAQGNKTRKSKNTTNYEKEKNNDRSTLHINYVALNSQYPLQILNHFA